MKKINKIIIIFFIFTFLAIYGGWRFIHSQDFSQRASKKISEVLTKKAGAKLSFSEMDFTFLPPSTMFKKVRITKNDPALADIDLSFEEVGVFFTYSSFFSSDLEVDDLKIKNGLIKIKTNDEKSPEIKWDELNLMAIFGDYSKILKQNPIQLEKIQMENIDLQVDRSSGQVATLTIVPHKNDLKLKLEMNKVHLDLNKPEIPIQELDIVSGEAKFSIARWNFDNLLIKKQAESLSTNVEFFNRGKKLEFDGSTNFILDVNKLLGYFSTLPNEVKSIAGFSEGRVKYDGLVSEPDLSLTGTIKSFTSDYAQLEHITIGARKKKDQILLTNFKAYNGNESYELLRPYPLFDLNKKELLKGRASFALKDAFTNTFLYSIKDTLSTLKGYVSGDVDVVWNGDTIDFNLKDRAVIKKFRLLSSDEKSSILENAGFGLQDSTITLDKNSNLAVNLKMTMANSLLNANGSIKSNGIHISIQNSKIDMNAFGPISGVALTGVGPINAEISGPYDDVKFKFDVDWKDFSVVDLNFGRVQSNFNFSLKNLSINIDKLTGKYGQNTNYTAIGNLRFGDKSKMDLKLDFSDTNFSDAQKMYNLVFKDLKLPVIPQFNFSASYQLSGGFDLESLKINGVVKGSELKVAGEEAEKIAFKFSLLNNLLSFKDIKINKSRGEVNANYSINLANTYSELDGSLAGLRLRDFNIYRKLNLEYDGDFAVDFDGNGTSRDFSSRFKVKVNNPFIGNIPASPSSALIYLNSNDIVVNANLLSGKIKIDSNINLKNNQAALKASVETTDLREMLGIVASHNINNKLIVGKIKATLNTQFNMATLAVKKFSMEIAQLYLRKNEIDLKVDPVHNSALIEEGIVKSWDLRFKDGNDYFISKAYNNSEGGIVYDQNFVIKANLLEFLTSKVEKAGGEIRGSGQLVVDKKISISKFELKGVKNSIKIQGLQGAISDLDFNLTKKGENFELSYLSAKYGEGEIGAKGSFFFDDFYPRINLEYKVEKSNVPLFKRSNILISSTGSITGTDLPYKLVGKVSVLHGEFLDDPSEFSKENQIKLDALKKYLPEKNIGDARGYLTLNLTFDSVNPVAIKNNMAEVYVKGSGIITGDTLSPEINARIEAVAPQSKFKFKGHDFSLNQGYVEIKDRGKNRTSDLKFVGLSKINDYDVKLDIFGTLDKTNINLSSEPALAQEDLVSLLTLGVTSDISKNLEASERKSVTTLGIGALLFEQLKINEDLNSTLGLKLSVLPEFKEDESSLIQGKSAVSEGSSSKLKSSTKIKINKQITNAIDVSVSSTVGGSIEQTQEMNINYNINKKFSLEGVYEVKPAEDENTNNSNSIGADLKYRWSF